MADIRAFTPADAPAVAAVQVGDSGHDSAPHFPPGFRDGVTVEQQTQDWPAQHPEDVLLVAEVAEYVLARGGAFHGTDAEVMALHDCPSSRNWEHRRALLRAAVVALHAAGAQSVGLSTLEGDPVRA